MSMNVTASSVALEAASTEKAKGDDIGNWRREKGGGEEKVPIVVEHRPSAEVDGPVI
jgi:hypothetical protein